MKDQRDRRTGLLRVVVTTLKPTVRAGKHHLWHGVPKPLSYRIGGVEAEPPWPDRCHLIVFQPSPRARPGVTI